MLLAGALALSTIPGPPILRDPDVHGDLITFVCEGDVWIGDLPSGAATRLTNTPTAETAPRFSPDGRTVAFTGVYDGLAGVYTIPVGGGAPTRVTFAESVAQRPDRFFVRNMDWRSDGQTILFRKWNYPGWSSLAEAPAGGGFAQDLPLEFVSHVAARPNGEGFAYTRVPRAGEAWFAYRGGQANPIWHFDGEIHTELFRAEGSAEYPAWVGDRIAFALDEGPGFALWTVGLDGQARRETPVGLDEIRDLGSDGETVVFELGMGIASWKPGQNQATPIEMELVSDLRHTLPYRVPAETHVESADVSPDGKSVLVGTRGSLLELPVGDGVARTWMSLPGTRLRRPAYSPDGGRVAFVSDATGQDQVWVARRDGSRARQLSNYAEGQLWSVDWSPDGRWIAVRDSHPELKLFDATDGTEHVVGRGYGWYGPTFSFSPDGQWIAVVAVDDRSLRQHVELVEIGSWRRHRIGESWTDEFAPSFSTDGDWLAVLSRRRFVVDRNRLIETYAIDDSVRPVLYALRKDVAEPGAVGPETAEDVEFRIDLEDLDRRFVEIDVPPGEYDQVAVIGDRLVLREGSTVTWHQIEGEASGTLPASTDFQVADDSHAVLLRQGAEVRVADVAEAEVESADFGGIQLRVEPLAEWRQIFWDAWRLTRDTFYDPDMHGVDWTAIGRRYERLLGSVRSRDELNEIVRLTLAELNVSHARVSGGDLRTPGPDAAAAYLGIDVSPDPSGFYRIDRILGQAALTDQERSPLARPGVEVSEGEFLIAIDGVPAKVGTPFLDALIGRAGRSVEIQVASEPEPSGARTIVVRPVNSERTMRYWDYIESRRRIVDELSDGRLGYLHIRGMGYANFGEFARQYLAQRDREGLVVDVRSNPGGLISDQINRILGREPNVWWNIRNNTTPWTRQGPIFLGPIATLVNELSGSNAEEFPYQFETQGIGRTFGVRTWGGEVGSDPGWPLVDGGSVSVPNYGAFSADGEWIVEGPGYMPMEVVQSDPNLWATGRDPQLEAAVAWLLAELESRPVQWPSVPEFPDKARRDLDPGPRG